MKRLIFASLVILSVAALALWGNQILSRTLDAQLPPLLSKQLGLPVQLDPIQSHALQLKATSPKLIMGDPKNPAVVATDVEVSLVLPALLHGEIRLKYVAASDLMVRPSRWPSSGKPLPENYSFLDPWLPKRLQVVTGRYVIEDGTSYPVKQLQWRRPFTGGASAQWSETRQAGKVTVNAQLKSLADLLQLAPIELDLTVEVADQPDSQISLQATIQPDKTAAYSLQADVQVATMTAHVVATSGAPWSLPEQSKTSIPLLEPDKLLDVIALYGNSDEEDDAATLPRLNLPTHQGHVAIAQIRIGDEVVQDAAFDFTNGEQGLKVSNLSGKGPSGILSGKLGILSSNEGWAVNVDASLEVREGQGSLAPAFLDSEWHWRTGHTTLDGKGDTWGALLYSLRGHISLAGEHSGKEKTPVEINAQLDNRPGEFALNQLAIRLGEGQLKGSAVLSGKDPRKLTMSLNGQRVDLHFLYEEEDTQSVIGFAVPEYLGFLDSVDMDLSIQVSGLKAPGLSLSRAQATLERTPQGGQFIASATGKYNGTAELILTAHTQSVGQPGDFKLVTHFKELDLPELFNQPSLLYSRTSGTMSFAGRGIDMREIFVAMKGSTNLSTEIRADNNWHRAPNQEEKLELTGNSNLVLKDDRIVGIKMEKLDIDSIKQDLTGDLSMVAGRVPWIIADLESDMLNVTSLLALLPKSSEEADDSDLLTSLKGLGPAQISLNAKSVTMRDVDLSDVRFDVVSGAEDIDLKQLDFVTQNGNLKSQAKITWKDEHATLEGTTALSNVDLDQFLIRSKDVEPVPVSGSAKLHSEGSTVGDLLGNMTGYINLHDGNPQQSGSEQGRRKLEMKSTRLPDGMQAEISSLQWGESDLSGSIRYYRTSPPMVEINIHSGTLSLLPWENAYLDKEKEDAEEKATTSLGSAAKTSADFVGNALLTPLRFISGGDEAKPGARIFSSDPLPLDDLKNFNMNVTAQLDSLLSKAITAKEVSVTGSLKNGQLDLKAASGQLSQGTGDIGLALDTNKVPPTLSLTSHFDNVHGLANRDTYPRSGFVSLKSQGQSLAELAANASGLVYLELGKGPFDYTNTTLFTDNISSTVFRTLIPGIERQTPQLECGVTVALFEDGKGATPYGFAARTNQANLLGRLQVDLGKERMQMSLDSRGRQGAGISVSSVFSNTIEIRGPLSDPGIVPNATGLIWRGWAAFMTAGLSVLGESLVKRVLASANPCPPITKMIIDDLCPKNPIAASSEMVCPKA